jgi:hypothetical protein
MDQWILLALTVLMVFIVFEMSRWLAATRRHRSRDAERLVEMPRDVETLPPKARQAMAQFVISKGFGFLYVLYGIAVVVCLSLLVATVKAFWP